MKMKVKFSVGREGYIRTSPLFYHIVYEQWRRKLENFEGDGDEKIGVKGVTPSKIHRFWPICLLPLDNFATFLDFPFLFFIFLY